MGRQGREGGNVSINIILLAYLQHIHIHDILLPELQFYGFIMTLILRYTP